ncbi:MAG TPA: hypothetical protein VGH43_17680 [Jatrophihabitans sp.]|jgi:hypothetical protein
MSVRRPATAAASVVTCILAIAAPTAAHATGTVKIPAATGTGRSLCAPPADTVGPVISEVTFGKTSIDLNSGSRTQTIRATGSDSSGNGAASGVSRVWLVIRGNRFGSEVRLQLSSGTPASGVWTGQFVVSKYAHPGTYSIEDLAATDVAGNGQVYRGFSKVPQGPDALSLHPADNPTFTVTGTPATPPARKPAGTLRSFMFTPSSVNTTSSARHVRVTAQFKGAAPHRVFVQFMSVKRSGLRFVYQRAVLRRSSGKWSGAVLIPRWIGKQALQPYLYAEFGSGYRPGTRSYSPDDLSQRHFPTKLAVVSGMDKTKPSLTSLTFSPSSIDSTTGPERVTVTAKATDIGSGVQYVYVNGGIRHGVNGAAGGAYPLAADGIGYLSSNYFSVRLKKGTDGRWVGATTIKQCVPSGTYKLNVAVRDVAGNYRSYSKRQLDNAHITSTVDVTSKHGDVAAPYIYSAATYAPQHAIFLNFSEGVATVDTSTLAVYPLSPISSRFTTPADVSAIVCSHGLDTIDCSGSGSLVTSAVLTVPSLTPGVRYDVYANLNQVTPQLVDGNGNPMGWNYESAEVRDS